jgi:nucleoside-diphosphate-sugar epimerase
MADATRHVTGHPELPLRAFPWLLATLAAPFVTLFRELREMRYLWRQPLQLDNRKLVAFLGNEPHTGLDQAVETTLRGLRCLPSAPVATLTEPRSLGS